MQRTVTLCALVSVLRLSGSEPPGGVQEMLDKARAFRDAGQFQQAAAEFRAAIHSIEESSPRDPLLPNMWNLLAASSIGMGAFADAEHEYKRAISLVEDIEGKDSVDYAMLTRNLAGLYCEEGRVVLARNLLQQAAEIESRVLGDDDPRTALVGITLVKLMLANGEYKDAGPLIDRLQRLCETPGACSADIMAAIWNDRAAVRQWRGDKSGAAALYELSISVLEEANGRDAVELLRPLVNLGNIYAKLNRPADAEAQFQRAMAMAERRYPSNHPFFGQTARTFAAFLRKIGKKAEAKALEAKILDGGQIVAAGMTVDRSELVR